MKPLLWRLAENWINGSETAPQWRIVVDGSASRIRSTRESSEDCARRLHKKRSIAWPNVSSHRYIMLTKEELVAEIERVENETILALPESIQKLREERDQAVKDLRRAQERIRSIMHNPSIDPNSLAGAIRKEGYDEGVASILPKYEEVRRMLIACEPLAHHSHGVCDGCNAKDLLDRTLPRPAPSRTAQIDPKISVGYDLYEPMITLTATLHRSSGESAVVSKQTFKVPKIIL